MRHDLKNILITIDSFILKNDIQAIKKQLQVLLEIKTLCYDEFTGCVAIDSILSVKIQKMKENSIICNHNLQIPSDLKIEDNSILDISAILGNLLDNAIEAVLRLEKDRERKIDIVFLMGFQVSLLVILMTFGKRCKYIFCDHEALLSRWNEKKITLIRYLTALLSNKIVTLTRKNALDYISKFKLSNKKVTYIYNSIDDKILKNVREYDTQSKIILSVGRFSPEKQYNVLVEIADSVLKRYLDWKWYIYGDGETFPEIQNKIRLLGLEERIILKGEASDVSKIYAQAAMFVLTSQREGLPLVLLEAKANHLPCISFDIISGPGEIIQDNIDGFLIKPYEKEEMIKAIETLINNKSLRIKMSKSTGNNLEKFSNKTIMEKWETLINTI